jgi:hypothetical protein
MTVRKPGGALLALTLRARSPVRIGIKPDALSRKNRENLPKKVVLPLAIARSSGRRSTSAAISRDD